VIASYAYSEQMSVNVTTRRTTDVLFNVTPHLYDAEVLCHADAALSYSLHGLLSTMVVDRADIKA